MDFILHQVVQFEHGHDADGDGLIIELTSSPIAYQLLADRRHGIACFEHKLLCLLFYFITFELGGNWLTQFLTPER